MSLTYQRKFFEIAVVLAATRCIAAADPGSLEERLNALEAQNKALQEELATQKEAVKELQKRVEEKGRTIEEKDEPESALGMKLGRVHLSGEGGVGFFQTTSNGQHPDGSFRVDEAKLFVEAPLWESTYFFGELDLVIREANDEFFHLGELYVDFENVLRFWTDENYLSVRVGRIDIPFGEEYLVRDVIDNPLISRSLSDLWGIDEGVEIYGGALGFDYVVAVQNGGHPTLEDFDGDKSIAGRIGYNFPSKTRLSFSGMRTGDLSTEEDELSEMWFGNGFFRSIGAEESTDTFHAEVFELDAQQFWKSGHVKLAAGYFNYDDSDSTSDNQRDGYYYYAEAMQNLTRKLYGAARFSQVIADDGMPIVGFGDFGKYFFGSLTKDLWRLSTGLGYRWSDNLTGKVEYGIEEGRLLSGIHRDNHFVGAEIGFRF